MRQVGHSRHRQQSAVLTNGQRNVLRALLASSSAPLPSLRHEVTHVLNVIEWLSLIKPRAQPALTYAGLLHDCDRLFPERRMREKDFPTYELYKRAHAKNCAGIASALLFTLGVPARTVSQTQRIIEDHEWGTTPASYIVMAADSLSFFTFNILDYYLERGPAATEKKIAFMYERLHPAERKLLLKNDIPFKHMPHIMQIFKHVMGRVKARSTKQ